jgi:Txe/YoeB family toxin of Txe-Axe toxin-antitoxin module
MEIKFSRHADRRMRLYKIDEKDVRNTIESIIIDKGLIVGKHEKVNYDLKSKYSYPLKVVFVIENDRIEVITAYPLKKERVK